MICSQQTKTDFGICRGILWTCRWSSKRSENESSERTYFGWKGKYIHCRYNEYGYQKNQWHRYFDKHFRNSLFEHSKFSIQFVFCSRIQIVNYLSSLLRSALNSAHLDYELFFTNCRGYNYCWWKMEPREWSYWWSKWRCKVLQRFRCRLCGQ